MKKIIVFIFCLATLNVVLTSLVFFSGRYMLGQKVNGVDVSLQKRSNVVQDVYNTISDNFVINFETQDIELPTSDFLTVSLDEGKFKQSAIDWILCKPIYSRLHIECDSQSLLNLLEECKIPSSDAKITCKDGLWELVPEQVGLQFNENEVAKRVMHSITNLENSASCKDLQICSVVSTVDLEDDYNKVAWLNDWSIAYDSSTGIYGRDLSKFVEDYALVLPEDYIKEFVKTLHKFEDNEGYLICDYDAEGNLKTTLVPYVTYGKYLDEDTEVKYIEEALKQHQSDKERKPAMKGYNDSISEQLAIFVSIDQQHLWVKKNEDIMYETDVVTGAKGRHDTPTGVYYISECINGKYLTGDNYKTWVNKWMRLTDKGVGLHDASWRGRFGNNIYEYNGSHGCINLPKDFAYKLYEDAYVGMPVVIY